MTELQRMAIKDPIPNGQPRISDIHTAVVKGHNVCVTLNR